jgi:hypothetical protein
MNNTASLDNLSTILTGVAGEYFVAGELSRRGYVASVTLRNTRGMDVIATNADASRSVGISVKTNRTNKKDRMVNEKAEAFQSETLFYVFVNLKGIAENPSFHVVPSKVVATSVYLDRWDLLGLDVATQPGAAVDGPKKRARG